MWNTSIRSWIQIEDPFCLVSNHTGSRRSDSEPRRPALGEHSGDTGYQGVEKSPEHAGSEVRWQVAMGPGLRWQPAPGSAEAQAERRKASVCAKAEHPFLLYVKRHFGYAKVRYRGLEKNRQRLTLLLGFANLLRVEPQLA